MPLNIPMPQLPLSGLNQAISTGGNLFQQMMHPVIQRENMMREWKQHLDNLALSKAASGRAAQAAEDAHRLAANKLDPTFEARQYAAVEDYFRNRPKRRASPISNQSIPTAQMGEGLGVFSPQGMINTQESLQKPSFDSSSTGIDLELMRAYPMLRGLYKKHFGVDPLAEEGHALHGPARDAADLDKLRRQMGEESEVYQNAKAQYDAAIDAKKDLRDLRARTKSGLKPGEKEFFDEKSGEPLGKEIPLTAKERQSEEGNSLFNSLYPYVYKGSSPFSGEGSIQRLENAAKNYKTDKKAAQLFDDLLLADKMMGATVVNEASTLKAANTNRSYQMLKDSLEAQDIPKIVKKLIKDYQIPASAQLKASMRYQKALSDARIKAKKGVPATQRLYYNPELQAQHEAQSSNITESDKKSHKQKKEIKIIDGKKYKKIKGEWYEIQ